MLILFLLFKSINSTLKVYAYGERQLLLNTTNYGIANFGLIPYGRKLQAALYLAPLTEDDRLCNQNTINYYDPYFNNLYHKWIIVEDGLCSVSIKAIQAQNLGAQILIIVAQPQQYELNIEDDGNGYQVAIPVIKLNNQQGGLLIKELELLIPGGQLSAFITFDQINKEQRSQVIFGLDIGNRETFKLIIHFKEYFDKLKEFVDFDLFYVFYDCSDCQSKLISDDCIKNGRYCQVDIDGLGFGKGTHLVMEQYRQLCLWKYSKQLWWKYMIYFSDQCTKPNQFEYCFKLFITDEIYSKFQDCFKDQDKLIINLLEEQQQIKQQLSVVFLPSIHINGVQYRGNIEALNIKNAICESMYGGEKLRVCMQEKVEFEKNNSYGLLVAFVFSISIIFLLFIKFIYREMLKRQVQQEIKQTVEQALSHYSQYY